MTRVGKLKRALAAHRAFVSDAPIRGFGFFLILFGLTALIFWGAVLPKPSPEPVLHGIEVAVY